MTREEILQQNLVDWMNAQHPSVYFRSDLGGVRVNIGLAMKLKRLQKYRAHPDFTIFKQVGGYPLLMLELKADERDVFMKRGGLVKGKDGKQAKHLLEQAAMCLMLQEDGYPADIVIGFEQATYSIDSYMAGELSYTVNVDRIIAEATRDQILSAADGHPVVAEMLLPDLLA